VFGKSPFCQLFLLHPLTVPPVSIEDFFPFGAGFYLFFFSVPVLCCNSSPVFFCADPLYRTCRSAPPPPCPIFALAASPSPRFLPEIPSSLFQPSFCSTLFLSKRLPRGVRRHFEPTLRSACGHGPGNVPSGRPIHEGVTMGRAPPAPPPRASSLPVST